MDYLFEVMKYLWIGTIWLGTAALITTGFVIIFNTIKNILIQSPEDWKELRTAVWHLTKKGLHVAGFIAGCLILGPWFAIPAVIYYLYRWLENT